MSTERKTDGDDLASFLKEMRQEGWLWGTFKNGRKYSMGAVKYVDAVYDARDGEVWSLTFRGLLADTTISDQNEWADVSIWDRARAFLRELHEYGAEIAIPSLVIQNAERLEAWNKAFEKKMEARKP